MKNTLEENTGEMKQGIKSAIWKTGWQKKIRTAKEKKRKY